MRAKLSGATWWPRHWRPRRPKGAVSSGNQHAEGQYGAAQQHEGLEGIGPNNGFDAPDGAVDDAQDAHDQDGLYGSKRCGGREGVSRQRHHDPHPEDMEEVETGTPEEAHAAVETLLEVFIGAGGINLAKKGQGDENRDRGHGDNHEIADHVGPVLRIGLRGDARIGQRAEHGRENRAARRPPSHFLAAAEIVVGIFVAPREIAADAHHGEEVEGEDGVVHGAKSSLRGYRAHRPDLWRAHARAHLATRDNNVVFAIYGPVDGHGRDVVGGQGSGGGPRVGDGVIREGLFGKARVLVFKFIGLVEERAVRTAQDEDVALSPAEPHTGHDRLRRIGPLTPLPKSGNVLPDVVEELDA